MKVKICGIMDQKTALTAVEYGADALGFIFADSKRKVSKETVREIVAQIPESIMKVGVFVNEAKEEIEQIASYAGLTHIQLHGEEPADFCASLPYPVIKAFSIESKTDIEQAGQFACDYILLDGPKGKYRGGNGLTFNWRYGEHAQSLDKKVILAGGLSEDNVLEAVYQVKPFMVDVSSGVETNGKKDFKKIKRFIDMVKSVEVK